MKEDVLPKDGYQVKLANFEGPLDLLLYLIRREEIDIYDIPIASITKQYLETIEFMKDLDLEVAGEFILMAATLIRIKVQMLLPRETEESEESEEDPRAELVRRLLEYKRFKEVAESLENMEIRQRRFFPRTYFDWEKRSSQKADPSEDTFLKDVSLFDLLEAFKVVVESMPRIDTHEVAATKATIEEQIHYVLGRLEEKERFAFADMMKEIKERLVVIMTFLALLELIRTRRIRIQQATPFGDIWISKTTGEAA